MHQVSDFSLIPLFSFRMIRITMRLYYHIFVCFVFTCFCLLLFVQIKLKYFMYSIWEGCRRSMRILSNSSQIEYIDIPNYGTTIYTPSQYSRIINMYIVSGTILNKVTWYGMKQMLKVGYIIKHGTVQYYWQYVFNCNILANYVICNYKFLLCTINKKIYVLSSLKDISSIKFTIIANIFISKIMLN